MSAFINASQTAARGFVAAHSKCAHGDGARTRVCQAAAALSTATNTLRITKFAIALNAARTAPRNGAKQSKADPVRSQQPCSYAGIGRQREKM